MKTRRLAAFGACSTLIAACGQTTPQSDGGPVDSGFALALSSVSPAQGPLIGGTQVTVTGNGFGPGLILLFGDAGASAVEVQTGTTLTAVTPPCPTAGPTNVQVSSPSGSASLIGGFTYLGPGTDGGSPDGGGDAGLAIAYCVLHYPATLTAATSQQAGPVYGWVYVPGVTDDAGQGPGITSEVGYGPVGSEPSATWSWAPATWDAKVGPSGHNDEYNGLLPAASDAGTYDYAVRFSRDNGMTWTPCDTGGDTPTTPYNPANAGVLTVAPPNPTGIGYCAVHFPTTLSADVGQGAGPVYGWVYVQGVTDQDAGPGPGITGELGQGALGSTPGATWTWIPAVWDAKQGPSGHNDEYMASLPAQGDAGLFAYAYRFEIDGGTEWAYCDTAGDSPYQPANEGVLTVTLVVDAGPVVEYCNFQYPDALLGEAFTVSTNVYGQVYELGVTDDAGQGPGIAGQAGFGPLGSDPSQDGGGWIWFVGSWYSKGGAPGTSQANNDEYAAQLAFPDAGTYAMAYRFALDTGPYRYCDSAGDAVYTPTNQAVLTVQPPPLTVTWCDLQYPAAIDADPDQDAGPVYGQVYKAGVTDGVGIGADIWAQLGVGPAAGDPALADAGFVWVTATWDGKRNGSSSSCGGGCPNDEYNAPLIAPNAGGSYAYYFRFSEDDGNVWTVCGYQDPLSQGGVAGALTVTGAAVDAGPDAGQDAGPDAGRDAGPDAGVDAGFDAGLDAGPDAGPDAGADAGLDAGPDAGSDAGVDAGFDAGFDGGSDAGPPPMPSYCIFQYPATLLGESATLTTNLYGVVYLAGVTDDAGQGPGIAGQAGIGPNGSDPSVDGGGWTWTDATYYSDFNGLTPNANDEYAAEILLPTVGTYAMAYRFNYEGGQYLYCDTAGDAPYQTANQATATVVAAPLTVGWCDLQYPPTITVTAGADAGPVYGQVYALGVTDGPAQGADIIGQLGVGPLGADPTSATSGFVWVGTTWDAKGGPSNHNDEYNAPLIAPTDAGAYNYYFRFTEDDGNVWTVCGYQAPISAGGDAGILTVE